MYGIRHIPVHWLVGFFNMMSVIYDFIVGTAERIWTFGSTIAWNLTGLDQYVVFQDENPTPIPYRFYMLGGIGGREWFYNMRSRTFELNVRGVSRKFLPALTIEYFGSADRRLMYDLTKWLDTVTFRSTDGVFPHPMQLVAAWSLHSGIWPSFQNEVDRLTMMCGADGNNYNVPISLVASPFSWRRFAAGEMEESESDEESESTESEATEESESEAESTESEATESEATSDEITYVTEIKESKPESPVLIEEPVIDRKALEEVD